MAFYSLLYTGALALARPFLFILQSRSVLKCYLKCLWALRCTRHVKDVPISSMVLFISVLAFPRELSTDEPSRVVKLFAVRQ